MVDVELSEEPVELLHARGALALSGEDLVQEVGRLDLVEDAAVVGIVPLPDLVHLALDEVLVRVFTLPAGHLLGWLSLHAAIAPADVDLLSLTLLFFLDDFADLVFFLFDFLGMAFVRLSLLNGPIHEIVGDRCLWNINFVISLSMRSSCNSCTRLRSVLLNEPFSLVACDHNLLALSL